MFFNQLEKLCKKTGLTPTSFIKELGYSSSKITAWKNGSIPKYEILNKISEYFNVPVSYLFEENGQQTNLSYLSPNQQELLDLYNQLDPIKQAEFKGELKGYLKAKNNQ